MICPSPGQIEPMASTTQLPPGVDPLGISHSGSIKSIETLQSMVSVREARSTTFASVKARQVLVGQQPTAQTDRMSTGRYQLTRTRTITRQPFNPVNASPRGIRRVPSSRRRPAPVRPVRVKKSSRHPHYSSSGRSSKSFPSCPPSRRPSKALPPDPPRTPFRTSPQASSTQSFPRPRNRRLRGPPNTPVTGLPNPFSCTPANVSRQSRTTSILESPLKSQKGQRNIISKLFIPDTPRTSVVRTDIEGVEDTPWREYDIPQELELVSHDMPEEIRNIVQESLDEHRAIRASRLHAQAIIVRTTITQSLSSNDEGKRPMDGESSAIVSHRRGKSPLSSEDSAISPTISDASSGFLQPPPKLLGQSGAMSSQESLYSDPSSGSATLLTRKDKRLKRDGFLWLFPGRKNKGAISPARSHESLKPCECTSCFDEVPNKNAVTLPCCHKYCSGCFSQLVTTAIINEDTFPPKCCLQEIPRTTLRQHLSSKQMTDYDQKRLEYAVSIGSRYYCARPDCAQWINTRLSQARGGVLKCSHCNFYTCGFCRGPQHADHEDCPHDFGLDATLEEAERAGWQRCYNCRAMVELNTGCRHITCKCRAEFCYTCGAKWRTCACTEQDQARRQYEITERRERMEAQARAEEAEIRAAIAAVEAAERELAAEQEAEEARLAEESRRITVREYERLDGIHRLFETLRNQMARVRKEQSEAIDKRHKAELAEIVKPEAPALYGGVAFGEAHVASMRAKMASDTVCKVQQLQRKHAKELVETISRHRKDEDNFLLKTYPPAVKDSEVRKEAVHELLLSAQQLERTTLKSQHIHGIQKWQKRRAMVLDDFDKKIDRQRAQIEEANQVARFEIMTKRQVFSDWKWVDAIFLDRELMLGEDERRTIMSGADAPSRALESSRGW